MNQRMIDLLHKIWRAILGDIETVSSEIMVVDDAVHQLPNIPDSATMAYISVSLGDIVFTTDPNRPPGVSPVIGRRLADGATETIMRSDLKAFQVRRLGTVNAQLYIDYKG